MLRITIAISLVSFFLNSCLPSPREKRRVLERSRDEFIEYHTIKNAGNFIKAGIKINERKIYYSLSVNDNGVIMHIRKYHNDSDLNDKNYLNFFRDLEMLVTDTSKPDDPLFFAYPINGYYDTLVNNVLFSSNTRKSLSPLLKEEVVLFSRIDSLTKIYNIKYLPVDTSKVLGWFKYIF